MFHIRRENIQIVAEVDVDIIREYVGYASSIFIERICKPIVFLRSILIS